MKPWLLAAPIAATLFTAAPVLAAEQICALAIDNPPHPDCATRLQSTLIELPGVQDVKLSSTAEQALVVFDDAQTSVAALIETAENWGCPVHELPFRW